MSLLTLYGLLILEYAALTGWFFLRYNPDWLGPPLADPGAAALSRRYARYCAPLAGYAILGFCADFTDRWLLQRFSGSAQQGYFALGQQFSAVTLLATTSILNIFWKELASSEASTDRSRTRELYARSSRALFFVSIAGGAFLAPHARTLLLLTAGPRFADAWPTLALMLTFPAFQSLGQLNGAFFYATEDTRTHVMISSFGLLLGLPLAWLILASKTASIPGLALGSVGLAARSWIIQAIAVSVQCVIVSRRLKGGLGPSRHWATFFGLMLLSLLCSLTATVVAKLFTIPYPEIVSLALAAVLYGFVVLTLLRRHPEIVGADQSHFDRLF